MLVFGGTGAIELTLKEIREAAAGGGREEEGRQEKEFYHERKYSGGVKSRRRGYVRLMLAREEERGERAQELTESFL